MTKLLFDRLRLQEKGTDFGAELANAHVFYNGTVMQEMAEDTIDMADVPSFALPYPITFVEADLPDADDDGNIIYRAGQQAGILFRQLDYDPTRSKALRFLRGECRWFIESTLFLNMPGWGKIDLVCQCMIALDDQGVILPVQYGTVDANTFGLWYLKRNPDFYDLLGQYMRETNAEMNLDDYDSFMSMILEGGLYTLGLLHCRNIGTEVVMPRRSESHKQEKRSGIPMSSYKVLVITGKSKVAGTIIGQRSIGKKHALHTCRAHFMNFTADAPLFGKYEGRFFVPSHIKGRISMGAISKDYDVAVKAENRIREE